MSGDRCKSRGDLARLPCQLPAGHVKTADDWHRVDTKVTQVHESAGVRTESTTTEVHTWAPHSFELHEDEDD